MSFKERVRSVASEAAEAAARIIVPTLVKQPTVSTAGAREVSKVENEKITVIDGDKEKTIINVSNNPVVAGQAVVMLEGFMIA